MIGPASHRKCAEQSEPRGLMWPGPGPSRRMLPPLSLQQKKESQQALNKVRKEILHKGKKRGLRSSHRQGSCASEGFGAVALTGGDFDPEGHLEISKDILACHNSWHFLGRSRGYC